MIKGTGKRILFAALVILLVIVGTVAVFWHHSPLRVLREAYGSRLCVEDRTFFYKAHDIAEPWPLDHTTETYTSLRSGHPQHECVPSDNPNVKMTLDKAEYTVGESIQLTLQHPENCLMESNYCVERYINGRWYSMNAAESFLAAEITPEAGTYSQEIRQPICGELVERDGDYVFSYTMQPGRYRLVKNVFVLPDAWKTREIEWAEAYAAAELETLFCEFSVVRK